MTLLKFLAGTTIPAPNTGVADRRRHSDDTLCVTLILTVK